MCPRCGRVGNHGKFCIACGAQRDGNAVNVAHTPSAPKTNLRPRSQVVQSPVNMPSAAGGSSQVNQARAQASAPQMEAAQGQGQGTGTVKKVVPVVILLVVCAVLAAVLIGGKDEPKATQVEEKTTTSAPAAASNEAQAPKIEVEEKPVPQEEPGVITGNDVIFRTEPSTAGRQIGVLGKNTQVAVLERQRCDDRSAGMITADAITVQTGGRNVSLKKGQAVNIIDDSGPNWKCTFKLGNEIRETYIAPQYIKLLYGEVWCRVRLNDGKEGYVYGDYVR